MRRWSRDRWGRRVSQDARRVITSYSIHYTKLYDSRWPPKVFSTGFIRAYAAFLSVDADPVLTEYFAFLEKRSFGDAPFHAKPEWLERERRRGSRRTAYTIAAA